MEAALIAARIWPWAALALAALVAVQEIRVQRLHTSLAKHEASQAKTAQTQAEQAQAATKKDASALLGHGQSTQTNVYEYTQKIHQLEAGRATDAARIASLQHDLRATATRQAQAASDLAACRNLADRHQELGELAARSAGVIGRSIGLVQQRDAEVTLLQKQVMTERVLVERLSSH